MGMAVLAFVVIAAYSASAQDNADPNMPVRPEGIWAGAGTKRPDHRPEAVISASQRKDVLQAIDSPLFSKRREYEAAEPGRHTPKWTELQISPLRSPGFPAESGVIGRLHAPLFGEAHTWPLLSAAK
jgi:hypothetical protein